MVILIIYVHTYKCTYQQQWAYIVDCTLSSDVKKHESFSNTSSTSLLYCKTTTEVSEILAPLEVSDNPQTILIEGAPGIGKTILLKHIALTLG